MVRQGNEERGRGGYTEMREPRDTGRRHQTRDLTISQSPRLSVSPSPFPRLISLTRLFILLAALGLFLPHIGTVAQRRVRSGSHSSSARDALTKEDRETVEQAIGIVCSERVQDPKGSVPIDEMQKRPSMPLQAPAVVGGAERAQRLLPVAKNLVISALRQLSATYKIDQARNYEARFNQAIARVQAVVRIKPDIDARDNASVYLKSPRTITFGTIFLAGLPSDEGMVSVLTHELVHISDGDGDSLRPLFRAVGERASSLTGMRIRDQRAEELTCDLVGEMAAQSFISDSPSYEPLPRRLARSVEHNCVDEDDSDEDHLSPRNTLRALLSLDTALRRQLVYGK